MERRHIKELLLTYGDKFAMIGSLATGIFSPFYNFLFSYSNIAPNVKMISDIAIKFKDGMIKELDSKANEMNSLLGSQVGGQLTAAIKNSVTKISESNNFKKGRKK
jgi:hypothetical protein